MKLYLRKKCTCSRENAWIGFHAFECDLRYEEGFSSKKKRKRFFLFYPLKKCWFQ